ncbi:MAG: tetratricopeptide repeat protein [Gammaproteobacteria bacterium]|nr:tetratricopeptide repeat protein [Gammaproteobacteria bacterium]
MTLFAAIAVLFTALSVGLVVWPLLRSGTATHPLAATLTALVIPAAAVLIYLLVSEHDWREPATGVPAPSAVSAEARSMEEAVASLERRLQDAPTDEEGWILLGSSYLSLNRPAEAVTAYQRALAISEGRNVDARLGVAEARIVLDPGSLTGPVGDDIEAVLKAEPRNPKGLWYGGLLSLARGQPAVARERWTTLLELSPPERVREIIAAQLAELDGPAAASLVPQAPAQSTPVVGSGSGISVMVSVSDALRAQVSPSAPVFVFVRDAQNPGPPLAVIRRLAQELPVTVQISDADIMLPGRTLASVGTATLVARIANGGDPIAKPGDVYGEASWQRATAPGGPVAIVIDRVVR